MPIVVPCFLFPFSQGPFFRRVLFVLGFLCIGVSFIFYFSGVLVLRSGWLYLLKLGPSPCRAACESASHLTPIFVLSEVHDLLQLV